jgi:hypothetical protein
MKIFVLLIVFLVVMVGCSTKQIVSNGTVTHEPKGFATEHGMYYYLPKTVIQVEVVAEKEVVKPGPFYRFGQRLLNISAVETESMEAWHLVSATIATTGIPDTKRQYRVSTIGKPSLAALSLTSSGILAAINTPGFYDLPKEEAVTERVISLSDIDFDEAPYSGEQLIKSSTAAMAEEVAKEIYRLRLLRNQILKGELETLPPDAGAYNLTLAEIDRQEGALLALFTGKRIKQTIKKVVDFLPEPGQILNTVILRFSQQNGFLDAMDVSGTPVYIEVDVDPSNLKDLVAAETSKSENVAGLVYCKPVVAQVKIIDRTLLLTSKQVYLAQFGQVLRMPADLFNSQGVGAELDVATGDIRGVFYK